VRNEKENSLAASPGTDIHAIYSWWLFLNTHIFNQHKHLSQAGSKSTFWPGVKICVGEDEEASVE